MNIIGDREFEYPVFRLLPIAAANFLYIALANLLPELSSIRSRLQSFKQILLIIFGMYLMFFLKQILG